MAYKITAAISGGSVDGTGSIYASFLDFTGGVASGTDGSSSNSSTTQVTTLTSGSFTTTVNGDIVVGIMVPKFPLASLAAGTGFTEENTVNLGSPPVPFYADELQIQSAHGAINPTFTMGGSGSSYVMVGGAIKKSSGTFSIVSSQNTSGVTAPGANVTIAPAATPTSGDALIVGVGYVLSGVTNATTRTVTDNSGNTFTELINVFVGSPLNLGVSFFYLLSFGGSPSAALHLLPLLGCGS